MFFHRILPYIQQSYFPISFLLVKITLKDFSCYTLKLSHCISLSLYQRDIGTMVSVFSNGLEDQGLIPGWVIPKTQKMLLDTPLLNTQHHKVQIKGKWSKQGREVAPSHMPQCSSNWKGSQLSANFQLFLYHPLLSQIFANKKNF